MVRGGGLETVVSCRKLTVFAPLTAGWSSSGWKYHFLLMEERGRDPGRREPGRREPGRRERDEGKERAREER